MKKQSRYFCGSDVSLSDSDDLVPFLLTQGVNKAGFNFLKELQSSLEFQMDGQVAKKVFVHTSDEKELYEENIELPSIEWEDHSMFFLVKNGKGNHVLGGSKPNGYKLPTHEKLNTPFQFVGSIDCTEEAFQWTGVEKLYLSYPLLECNTGIFLDCSDEMSPKILNPETFSDAWYNDSLKNLYDIRFKEMKYRIQKKVDLEVFADDCNDIILCGVPIWYQYPEIPMCPISGKPMKYVCTINSDVEIEIENKDESIDLPFSLEYLSFADEGHLYIFYQPETKIMHLSIQF